MLTTPGHRRIKILLIIKSYGAEGCNIQRIYQLLNPVTKWPVITQNVNEMIEEGLLRIIDHSAGAQGTKSYSITAKGVYYLDYAKQESKDPRARFFHGAFPDELSD